MGLFGRDDRPAPIKPEFEEPVVPSRPLPKPQPTSSARTVISPPSRIDGTLSSSGDITLEGELTGRVETSGHLLVASSGKVKANLHGRKVTIDGTVKGDITADERIELEPSANVHGNITAPRILIKDGATFEGQVFMKSPAKGPDKPADQAKGGAAEPGKSQAEDKAEGQGGDQGKQNNGGKGKG